MGRVAPAASDADSADEPVEPAAHRPGQREGVPAVLPADALHHPPQRGRRGVHVQSPVVLVQAAAGPVGVGGQRVAGGAGQGGGGPAGDHVGVAHALEGQGEGLVEAERRPRRVGDVLGDVVLLAHHLVAQRFGERSGEASRHRGDQPDPVAGQSRGEHRDAQDEPFGELRHGGVAAHHLLVRDHVRPADVEGPADLGRHRGAADEVAQDVTDGDGLAAGADPARGDHDGQPLGEVAQHLEGGRAGSDDDGGAQHGGRDGGGQEDLPDLGAGAQVRGEFPDRDPGGGEPAQVDDPPDPCRVGLLGEDPGGGAVPVLEAGAGAEGVDEVVGHVDVAQGLPTERGSTTSPRTTSARPPRGGRAVSPGSGRGNGPGGRRRGARAPAAADVAGGPGDQTSQACHDVSPLLVVPVGTSYGRSRGMPGDLVGVTSLGIRPGRRDRMRRPPDRRIRMTCPGRKVIQKARPPPQHRLTSCPGVPCARHRGSPAW